MDNINSSTAPSVFPSSNPDQFRSNTHLNLSIMLLVKEFEKYIGPTYVCTIAFRDFPFASHCYDSAASYKQYLLKIYIEREGERERQKKTAETCKSNENAITMAFVRLYSFRMYGVHINTRASSNWRRR